MLKFLRRLMARRVRLNRRRSVLESLGSRMLMAVDLEVPPVIISQFPVDLKVVDSVSAAGIGGLVKSLNLEQIAFVFQSEAINGFLYSVGQDNGEAANVFTDLRNGISQKKILPALLANSQAGGISTIGKDSAGNRIFAGASQYNVGGSFAATKWDSQGNPSAVSLPSGALSLTGTSRVISTNGFIGGEISNSGAFIATIQGSFNLPKNQTGVQSSVLSISDTGRFASGGIGFETAVWKAQGNPEEGNYQLLSFNWEMPQDAQGMKAMGIVMENATYGGLGMTQYLDDNGDAHAGIWSLTDGSLLQDFGAGSSIEDAKIINGTTYIAYNDASGAHVLDFESNKVYDLKTLLGSNATLELSPDAIFTDVINGKPVIGFSYYENNALKASVFNLGVTADLAWDFDNNGTVDLTKTAVPLPDLTSHVYTNPGQTTVKVTVTIDGVPTTIEKTFNVVNAAVIDRSLYVGGDSSDDVVVLTKLPSGNLKVSVNGTESQFAAGAVDQVFANLDGGSNSLEVSGLDLDSANLWHVGKLTLTNGATLTNFTSLAASQMGSEPEGGEDPVAPILVLEVSPMTTEVNPITFSSDWTYDNPVTVNGVVSHRLSANGVQILVSNGVYQNPINRLDTSGDGKLTPLDALLVINYLNLRSAGQPNLPILLGLNVNGDNSISPIDVLIVINYLNLRGGSGGEGEGEGEPIASDTTADTPAGWFYFGDDSIEPASFKRRTLEKCS